MFRFSLDDPMERENMQNFPLITYTIFHSRNQHRPLKSRKYSWQFEQVVWSGGIGIPMANIRWQHTLGRRVVKLCEATMPVYPKHPSAIFGLILNILCGVDGF